MNKQVQKNDTHTNSPVVMQDTQTEVLRSDMIVPYILLMQGLSDFVTEGKARAGDIIRSTSVEKIGSADAPITIIPLHYPQGDWVIEQQGKGEKFFYKKAFPRTAKNENLAYKFWGDDDGNEVLDAKGNPFSLDANPKGAILHKRVKRLRVFCILPSDIEAEAFEREKIAKGELPDPSKALTPVLVSFRSTSYDAGKALATFATQAQSMGAKLWQYQLPLSCVMEKNDQGTYYVWQLDRTKAKGVPKEALPVVERWAQIVGQSASSLNVDEGADTEAQTRTVNPNAQNIV